MEFLEFQAFIENDNLFPFYLRKHVSGKKKTLWKEQKISYSTDQFILIDSGLAVGSYGKKQIIYQLAGKDQFIFFNQSNSYLEALEHTHYREFTIEDLVEQLEEEKLLDHFLLFVFKKEEQIVQKLVELGNMQVKERIYYLLNELFFLDCGFHIEDKKEGVYSLPSWLKMSVFRRFVRTSAANLSQQLHPLTRNHILLTHKKPWQVNVKLWNDYYKDIFCL